MKLVKDIPLYICGGDGKETGLGYSIIYICGEHGKETGLNYSFKCICWGWDGNLLGLFH